MLGLGGEFRYVHQLKDPHDRIVILEFATRVEGKRVEGIDQLTFDEDGMITELKVMIGPASALEGPGRGARHPSVRSARDPAGRVVILSIELVLARGGSIGHFERAVREPYSCWRP